MITEGTSGATRGADLGGRQALGIQFPTVSHWNPVHDVTHIVNRGDLPSKPHSGVFGIAELRK